MAKITLTDIAAGYALITTINANNALIEAAIENTVSLDATSPNAWTAAQDANSQKLTNLPDAVNDQEPATLAQLTAALTASSSVAAANTTVADAAGYWTAVNGEAIFKEIAEVKELIVKAEGKSIDTNTTVEADNELVGFTMAADTEYILEAQLFYAQSVGNLRFLFSPSQALQVSRMVWSAVAADGTVQADYASGDITTANDVTALTDGQACSVYVRGYLKTHATLASTLALHWAQATSDATNTSMATSSWMSIERITAVSP